jgi:manganese transport protein
MAFVFVIGVCYAFEVFLVHPDWHEVAFHTLVPMLDRKSAYVAVAMLGATVMPHVVYLHSGLVQPRLAEDLASLPPEKNHVLSTGVATGDGAEKPASSFDLPNAANATAARIRHLRFELVDVLAAMNGAWLINSAMVIVAAAAFMRLGHPIDSVEEAHHTLGPLLGPLSATLFAIALLCSGLSSSTVGTMAGQMILEGFLDIKFSIFLRRFITLLPALVVLGMGFDAYKVLLASQALLSFTLPFALVPLLILTNRTGVMQQFTNQSLTRLAGWLTVGIILALNMFLLVQLFRG